jgi:NAD(P)-dependent dehydrogenase (short-subunit alcohol dehydrogenase family)
MMSQANRGLQSLQDRIVVITGGSSGIGLATAHEVVALGGRVALVGRSLDRLKRACQELGEAASAIQLDVTDEHAVEEAFRKIDRIDHLVTAAAGGLRGRLAELNTALARGLFESKFWGQHYCVRYATPRMAHDGSMVLVSGWVSRKPAIEMSTMAAVDGAIEAFARSLALELAPIRVNAVTPGQIDTPLWRNRLSESEARAYFDQVAQSNPVGRVGTAEDVASAILLLMRNGFMSGAVLDVDGGWW